MEGDPHPGAMKGRVSFRSFNPSIDVSIKVHGPVQIWLMAIHLLCSFGFYSEHIEALSW